jgi:hypothetical protein
MVNPVCDEEEKEYEVAGKFEEDSRRPRRQAHDAVVSGAML